MIDITFTSKIESPKEGWTCIFWPQSAEFLGTRKAIKVKGTIDGHDFTSAFLPWGDGTHILGIKKSLIAVLDKKVGDSVSVHLTERL